jgi:alkylation response protein AidB-like acyl-CoA dehydrogenase
MTDHLHASVTAGDAAFREEVRDWLRSNIPGEPRPRSGAAMRDFDTAWQRTQWEGGWAGVSWPVRSGGRGLSPVQQMIWYEEYALADAPYVGISFVGLNHAGPTLMERGTDEQQRAHLGPILRGEAVWCQGFSEPDAGSDLASLRTRAKVDGDVLVVNGQKIWTSYAHLADFQELLVRTDADAERHQGLSWVVCDMRSRGITVRPIRVMPGVEHFCEVFYDDVRIPLSNVVGGLNQGWSVAMTTLSIERGAAFMADQVALARTVERLIEVARERPGPDGRRPAIADDAIARDLARARAETAALRAMTYATVARNLRDGRPGPEGSLPKVYYSDVVQRVYQLGMTILGPDALVMNSELHGVDWVFHYLDSFARSIGAGTREIQKNIIGERVLGLPRAR